MIIKLEVIVDWYSLN